MKILKTVSSEKIPSKITTQGAKRNSEYDALAEKILSLSDGKSLPIECESKNELNSLRAVLRKRDLMKSY
jgi:hypothetical protein